MKHFHLCYLPFCLLLCGALSAQDTLSFGGVYDLPGAEVRSTYRAASPLAYDFTVEEVYRLPSTFYDPARLVALLPGVVQTNDQANHLSVRGNSPGRNLWRLNGLAIMNPNHTSNAGTFYDFPTFSGGGVNAISAQMLDNSGFLAGGLPVEYGFAQGGTFDLRLRPGNKTEHKQQVQAGFIGFDLAAEGPIARGKTSYLVNARYSFTGLLANAGVDFGGEEISFADVNLHLHHRDDWGELSLFGVAGGSSNDFTATDPEEQELEEQKELFDINAAGSMTIIGANAQFNLPRGVLKLGLALSNAPETDREASFADRSGQVSRVSILQKQTSAFIDYQRSLNEVFTVKVGAEGLARELGVSSVFLSNDGSNALRIGENLRASSVAPYVGLDMQMEKLSFDYGFRYALHDMSEDGSPENFFEPRIIVTYRGDESVVRLAGETVSNVPLPAQYVAGAMNTGIVPTALQTVQLSLSYARKFGAVSTQLTGYAQRTADDLAANQDGFLYSASNLLEVDPFIAFDTVADTRRLGLELEVAGGRKDRGWYYRGSLSVFNSQTEQSEENWSDNRFDTDFAGKITVGREWNGVDKKERKRLFGLNAALIAHGGERYGRIVERVNEEIEVLNYFAQPDYSRGFVNDLNTYVRPDVRLYTTKYRPNSIRTLALDIQNVGAIPNVGNVYYDTFLGRPNERLQLSLIPVLSYRIVW